MLKRTIVCALLIATASGIKAQKSSWDSTYRPGIYTLMVQEFESYPHRSSDIVFLGNSITAHAFWNELLDLPQARNRGISGDITFGVLERLDEVINGKPAKVFILIGINDISRNIPDSVIIGNERKIVQRIKAGSPQTKIYLQTIMPTNSSFGKFPHHYHKEEHIHRVNEGLKQIAATEGITLIDLYPHFLDAQGNLDERYTLDGLHPNAKGYEVWKKVLEKYLR